MSGNFNFNAVINTTIEELRKIAEKSQATKHSTMGGKPIRHVTIHENSWCKTVIKDE